MKLPVMHLYSAQVPICFSLRAPGSWNPENQLKMATATDKVSRLRF